MQLLKYAGLELPVFSAEEPLLHYFNLVRNVTASTDAEVLRHCDMSLPEGCFPDLASVLASAKREFNILAATGTVGIVPHQWGLYSLDAAIAQDMRHLRHFKPVENELRARRGYQLLPPGYILAAKVTVIDSISPPLPPSSVDLNTLEAEADIDSYNEGVRGPKRLLRLKEVDLAQCVYGVARDNTKQTPLHTLVDIEPRFAYLE
jgi:hypothetical protein